MPWNLVDSLSAPDGRRAFCLPLNTLPFETQLEFSENRPEERTLDSVLSIKIKPGEGGFTTGGEFSDPALSVHALGRAKVRFKPADSVRQDRLVLTLVVFGTSLFEGVHVLARFPTWWQRWKDAKCIPLRVIYENVDRTSIRSVLENINAPVDDRDPDSVPATDGLRFPDGVLEGALKKAFIDSFMKGDDDHYIEAETEAYLGLVADDPADSSLPFKAHLLKLHAEYNDHSSSNPHPMNPRELFHLLFGDGSVEAKSHPLLVKLNNYGLSQPGHESRSMRLRPPFRTHARLLWEADLEVKNAGVPGDVDHASSWALSNSCAARLYNNHVREDRRFDQGSYTTCKGGGCWKCNLLVMDVALRAGFRVKIHPVDIKKQDDDPEPKKVWHYGDPQWVAEHVDGVPIQRKGKYIDRAELKGKIEKDTVVWGFKIEGRLRAHKGTKIDPALVRDTLNSMMTEEGRCLIVAVGRRVSANGHMVIVESVLQDAKNPLVFAGVGHGFSTLFLKTYEMKELGAERVVRRGFRIGSDDVALIHIVELHPGEDPDTPRGMRNCNVQA